MAFTMVFIALLFQRVFEVKNKLARYDFFSAYYQFLKTRLMTNKVWSGFPGVFIIILPAFIAFALFIMMVYHLMGVLIYYLISLLVLWYYLDARRTPEEVVGKVKTADVLAFSYQRIFAVIFWFALLGAVGVVLYTLIVSLRLELEQSAQLAENEHSILKATIMCEGVLDWVPVRLLGLTYALVGEFTPTFRSLLKNLLTGMGHTREQVTEWAMLSLGLPPEEDSVLEASLHQAVDTLISRAAVVWVVVLALFALGRWLS